MTNAKTIIHLPVAVAPALIMFNHKAFHTYRAIYSLTYLTHLNKVGSCSTKWWGGTILIHCYHLVAKTDSAASWRIQQDEHQINRRYFGSNYFYLIHITPFEKVVWSHWCKVCQCMSCVFVALNYSMSKSSISTVPSLLTQGKGKGT